MSILQNAVDSIQIGVEDYEADDNRRNISAIRNILAGILLLYKEKLCRLSPASSKELLIKQNIRPTNDEEGNIVFEGKGNHTVNIENIKDRFRSLKVNVDWKRFEEINALRNDIEHYYTSKSPDAVREIITGSFLLIRDFIANELQEDPQTLIGNICWEVLLDVAEVYSAEESACKASLEKMDWKYYTIREALEYLRCPSCHSSLVHAPDESEIYPNINLHCKSCDHNFCCEEAIEQCVRDSLFGEAYIAATDGGEPPYDLCPECGKDTFVFAEKCCIVCEYQVRFTNCARCGQGLILDDQDNQGICSYCQYMWEKVMAE